MPPFSDGLSSLFTYAEYYDVCNRLSNYNTVNLII